MRKLGLAVPVLGACVSATSAQVVDRTGIGVQNVAAFWEVPAARGLTCEMMLGGAAAMIMDPGGVAIELDAGLESR